MQTQTQMAKATKLRCTHTCTTHTHTQTHTRTYNSNTHSSGIDEVALPLLPFMSAYVARLKNLHKRHSGVLPPDCVLHVRAMLAGILVGARYPLHGCANDAGQGGVVAGYGGRSGPSAAAKDEQEEVSVVLYALCAVGMWEVLLDAELSSKGCRFWVSSRTCLRFTKTRLPLVSLFDGLLASSTPCRWRRSGVTCSLCTRTWPK